MYEEYYGFSHPPFSLNPDPRFLYRSESHEVALQQVWQAIRRREGFIVLTGDIGTGKTTLCRTILQQFEPTTFTALILDPFLSVAELLREVLLHYGIATREGLRTGSLAAASKHELIRTLHDFLLSLAPIDGSAVLLIDEAQHLSPEVLEEVRVLSNLETGERKLLQIVLVGQLNLLDVLRDAKLRQLQQRISLRCLLRPLTRVEVDAYISHRLWVAGGRSTVAFTPAAVDRVLALSGGIPRVINLICDRALMAGVHAQIDTIGDELVSDAAQALHLTTATAPGVSPTGVAAGAAAVPPAPLAPDSADALRVRVPHERPRSRRPTAALVLPLLAGAVVALLVFAATPLAIFAGDRPDVAAPDRATLLAPPVTLGVPDDLDGLSPPPRNDDAYSVQVGTFATPEEASAAERALRERQLPTYAFDLRYADGVRRRLFVGRYPTRQDAEAVRAGLAPVFADARVTLEWFERIR